MITQRNQASEQPVDPAEPVKGVYEAPRLTGKRALDSVTLESPIVVGDPGSGTGRFGHP
jgi:hypothetical protein